jgi:hypothetical protein
MQTDATGHPLILITRALYFTKLHWRLANKGRLPMWTVYRPVTREYPGKWCARMFVTLPAAKPTRFVIAHDSLEELRAILPQGLANIGRDPDDPPEIEETWI